jgi:hypothetical protein
MKGGPTRGYIIFFKEVLGCKALEFVNFATNVTCHTTVEPRYNVHASIFDQLKMLSTRQNKNVRKSTYWDESTDLWDREQLKADWMKSEKQALHENRLMELLGVLVQTLTLSLTLTFLSPIDVVHLSETSSYFLEALAAQRKFALLQLKEEAEHKQQADAAVRIINCSNDRAAAKNTTEAIAVFGFDYREMTKAEYGRKKHNLRRLVHPDKWRGIDNTDLAEDASRKLNSAVEIGDTHFKNLESPIDLCSNDHASSKIPWADLAEEAAKAMRASAVSHGTTMDELATLFGQGHGKIVSWAKSACVLDGEYETPTPWPNVALRCLREQAVHLKAEDQKNIITQLKAQLNFSHQVTIAIIEANRLVGIKGWERQQTLTSVFVAILMHVRKTIKLLEAPKSDVSNGDRGARSHAVPRLPPASSPRAKGEETPKSDVGNGDRGARSRQEAEAHVMDSGSETESESSQKARSGPIFQRKESRSWAFPSSDISNVCNMQDHREVVLVKSGFITSDTDGDGRESNLNHGGADRALPEASEVDPIAFDNASEAAEKAGGAAKMAGVAVEKAGAAVETAGAIVAEAGAIVAEAVEVAAAKEAEKHQNAAEKAGAAAAVTGAQSSGSTSTRKKRKKRSNTKQLDRAHLIMYV